MYYNTFVEQYIYNMIRNLNGVYVMIMHSLVVHFVSYFVSVTSPTSGCLRHMIGLAGVTSRATKWTGSVYLSHCIQTCGDND